VARKDAPLLFDTRLQAKSAYWGVVDPTKIGATTSPTVSTSPTTSTSPSPSPGTSSCAVTYRVTGSWPGGFQGDVKIANTGASAISSWKLAWTFTAGQTISQLWNGSVAQSGTAVTVTNASWNGSIAAGGSQSVGFLASWTGSNPAPPAFTLNGTACTVL
jgi:endo-1,4-beta-xylanase